MIKNSGLFRIFTVITTFIIVYNQPHITKLLEYYNKHFNKFTGGKLHLEYNNNKGFQCITDEDIYKRNFIFKIPKEYVVCAFELFPFKFELKEVLQNYFNHKKDFSDIKADPNSKIIAYLFAYQLMYMDYSNKTYIEEGLKDNKMKYYITKKTKQVYDYYKSLSREIYSIYMYDKEEFNLMNLLGINNDKYELVEDVHNYMINNIKNKYSNLQVS
jgi:hypothetical protein